MANSNNSLTPMVSVIRRGGSIDKIPVSLDLYLQAAKTGKSVPDYFRAQYGENADPNYAKGDVFAQAMASLGLDITQKGRGFRGMTLQEVLHGDFQASTTAEKEAARILAPAAILSLYEENPMKNRSDEFKLYKQMLAVDTSVTSRSFEYPIFNSSNADEQLDSVISQLATPTIVGQLTVGDKTYKVPTYSYGVEVSDEAKAAFTIDHLAIYLNRLKHRLSYRRMMSQISAVINGDEDMDMKPLQPEAFTKYDPAAPAGKLTQDGWMEWLFSERELRQIDYVLCDLKTYKKIINREGRPTILNQPVTSVEMGAYPAKPINLDIFEPQIFIVKNGTIPTDTLVGIDSQGAIARVSNSFANYEATQDLVMRRGTQLRFDYGEVVYRQEETAWSVITLA